MTKRTRYNVITTEKGKKENENENEKGKRNPPRI